MKLFVTTMLALSLAATMASADSQVVKKLKNCGVEAKNEFGSHIEYPATKEGAGYVGFFTVDEDASGTKQRYSLVNCATRDMVQVKAEYKLQDAAKTAKSGKDLMSFVAGLRKQGMLANEQAFAKLAKQAGYKPGTATLPPRGSESTGRSDCGCKTFYPDLFYSN